MPKKRKMDPATYSYTLRSRHKEESQQNIVMVFSSESDTDSDGDVAGLKKETVSFRERMPSSGDPGCSAFNQEEYHSDSELNRARTVQTDESDHRSVADPDSSSDSNNRETPNIQGCGPVEIEGVGRPTVESPAHTSEADDSANSSDGGGDDGDKEEDDDAEGEEDDDEGEENSDDDGSGEDSDRQELRDEPGLRIDDQPLYPGAPLTVVESLVATLVFVLVHSLSGAAISDLLALVALHCVKPHLYKATLYKFKKYFADIKAPLSFQYFCDKCYTALKANTVCHRCQNSSLRYFMCLSVENQLKAFFSRPGFLLFLQHRFQRNKQNANNVEDIYDGNVYRDDRVFTSNPNNITFTLYSDGISIYKSSKYSVWPLLLAINELPYGERIKKENMVLAGLWFGKDKPKANLFLLSFHSEFKRLYNGVSFNFPDRPNVLVRAKVVCATFDMDAKAAFCNMNKWSGYFSCLKCTTKGEKSERTSNVLVFPFDENAQPRSKESYNQSTTAAIETGKATQGVKGPSVLSTFLPDVTRCIPIDAMHCLFQGHVKRLMTLWFSSDYREENFSLYGITNVVSDYLARVMPASYVQRLPRSIELHQSYWKASEVRNWFFFYSLPILQTIMLPVYFQHYLLLVYSVYLLSQDSISQECIDLASIMLRKYVSTFEELYTVRHMSLNVHSLLHLSQSVKELGPLWVYSCFPFENINGQLVKLVHGTRYAEVQLMSLVGLHMNLPIIVRKLPQNDIREFCLKLLKKGHVKKSVPISGNCFAIGKIVYLTVVPHEIRQALLASSVEYRKVHLFSKLLKNGELYFSQSYARKVKTNSTYVAYKADEQTVFGVISSFVRVTECNCNRLCECQGSPYAIVKRLNTRMTFSLNDPRSCVSFAQLFTLSEHVEAIALSDLLSVCFVVRVTEGTTEKMYVMKPPNRFERE